MPSARLRLVADIGGTRTRFALSRSGGELERPLVVATADCGSLVGGVRHYLDGLPEPAQPTEAVFAVASPVSGDRVELTNSAWGFSIEETRRELGVERLLIVNDVEALAAALPFMEDADMVKVGGREALANAPRAVVAPGTGLGMAGLIPVGGHWVPLASEGGHVSFAPHDDAEVQLLHHLRGRFGHVSAERLVSGPGLLNIYRFLVESEGGEQEDYRPEDVSSNARSQSDRLCMEAMRQFTAVLGSVAGDLALTLGARGGVYIGGGIVADLGAAFDGALFCQRFAAKGRLGAYLDSIPAYVVHHKYPALLGAAHLSMDDGR